MSKKYSTLFYIGRFQPFHRGHLEVVMKAKELADRVVILIGSSYRSRSPRNPFTFMERAIMIETSLTDANISLNDFGIFPIRDHMYNDLNWITEVRNSIDIFGQGDRVGIIGFSKDSTSEYLKWFPGIETEIIPHQYSTLNSSDIRKDYFQPFFRIPTKMHCPQAVITWLENFTVAPEFKWLVDYYKQDTHDIALYGKGPAMCADALVQQSGHILLVTRKKHPGKGQLALPGGHLDPGETLRDCSVRELREETMMMDERGKIPPGRLLSFIDKRKTKTYDHPERGTGPRKITQLFNYQLPDSKELYYVMGSDDAEKADWYSLSGLRASDLFHDHAFVIMDQLGITLKD